MPNLPSHFARRRLRRLERIVQRIQGKGYQVPSLEHEVWMARRFLPQSGGIVFDVGAHRGEWTRELLRQAPGIAEVHCFEPSASHWPEIAAIGDPRVRLVQAAVADSVGEAVLYSTEPGSVLASLTARDLSHMGLTFEHTERVRTLTLDSYLQSGAIERVDYLKLDVEGHELAALRGADAALRRKAINALSFEFGGCNIDTRVFFRDFWKLLTGHGYSLYRLAPRRRLWPVESYSEEAESFLFANYVALSEGLAALRNSRPRA
jgi:FkbM family methyltransferase